MSHIPYAGNHRIWGEPYQAVAKVGAPHFKKLRGTAVKRASIPEPLIAIFLSHLYSGLPVRAIVLFDIFLNRYQQYEEDRVYRVAKFELDQIL